MLCMAARIRLRDFVQPIRRKSIADDVVDQLVKAIAKGALPPNFRLIEQRLAAELGVSRVPVREALRELSLLGVLEDAPGRGWKIAQFDVKHVREVTSIRIALESLMMGAAIKRLQKQPELAKGMDDELVKMREAAVRDDGAAMRRSDIAFHRQAIVIADNRIGMQIWEGLSNHVMIIFGLEHFYNPELASVVRQHEELRHLLVEGEADELDEILKDHIAGQRSLLGAAQNGTTKDTRG